MYLQRWDYKEHSHIGSSQDYGEKHFTDEEKEIWETLGNPSRASLKTPRRGLR
jgi:hypothetical protein